MQRVIVGTANRDPEPQRLQHSGFWPVSPTHLWHILLAALAVIAILGLAVELLNYLSQTPPSKSLVGLFSLSYEGNVPTWYSSCLLFSCGLVLWTMAHAAVRNRAPYRWHWCVLAFLFFYMSLDESAGIHENLGGLVELHGIFYFSWVLPAALFVLVVGLAYLPFLLHLPRKTRERFFLAGTIYVAGALGMELPLGYWTERAGDDNLVYALIDFIEETLEMLGASLFLVSLWHHAASGNDPDQAEQAEQ